MITNENGDVAITYFQSSGKYLRMGDGTEYVFSKIRNVCMSWVDPKHVDRVLATTRKKCCGGNKKRVFRLSSQQEVNLWTGVGGVR